MNGGAIGFTPDVRLPDGKRLAYRMDYVVKVREKMYIISGELINSESR